MATTPKKMTFKSTVNGADLGGYTTLAQENAGVTKGVPKRKPTESKGGSGLMGAKTKVLSQTPNAPRQPSQPVQPATYNAGNLGGVAGAARTGNVAPYQAAYVPAGDTGTGGAGNAGSDLTGFANNFRPEAIQALLSQPEVILSTLMQKQGLNPTGAGAGLMALGTPYMDALNAVMPLAWGGAMPPNTSAPINWLASMGQQGMTTGGLGIDFHKVLDSLSGLGSGTPAFQSLFGTGMAPSDQVNAVKQILYGAAQASLPEFFQRAVQNQLNQAGLNYLSSQYGGGKPAGFNTAIPNFFG